MKIVKLRSDAERGLELWFGHCRSIMDDKEHERAVNNDSEYTAADFRCMTAALKFMLGKFETAKTTTEKKL